VSHLCVNTLPENQSISIIFFFRGETAPSGARPSHYRRFTITLRNTIPDRTPLDEGSARRRELYLTTHNTHNRQPSMLPATLASDRPQTNALDSAATGIS